MIRGRLPAVGSIVLVTREDAHVEDSQIGAREMPAAVVVRTIGWLVAKDRKGIAVAPERTDGCETPYRNPTRIPRGMLLDVTRICSGR
jgi:hypothetical protein